jgi:hypothetical protein
VKTSHFRLSARRLATLVLASSLVLAAAIAFQNRIAESASPPLPLYPPAHATARPVSLGIFDAAPTAAEVARAKAADVANAASVLTNSSDAAVPEPFLPGQQSGGIHIALEHLGPGDRAIFFFRTSKGRVCSGLTGFSSGCLEGLPDTVPITATAADPDGDRVGDPALVWGVTTNDVESVDVIVNGVAHAAVTGRNTYFYELSDPSLLSSSITAVIAHLGNGAAVTTPVDTGPAPGAHPKLIVSPFG